MFAEAFFPRTRRRKEVALAGREPLAACSRRAFVQYPSRVQERTRCWPANKRFPCICRLRETDLDLLHRVFGGFVQDVKRKTSIFASLSNAGFASRNNLPLDHAPRHLRWEKVYAMCRIGKEIKRKSTC